MDNKINFRHLNAVYQDYINKKFEIFPKYYYLGFFEGVLYSLGVMTWDENGFGVYIKEYETTNWFGKKVCRKENREQALGRMIKEVLEKHPI